MKKFNKSHKLDNVHYAIRGSVMKEASKMEERRNKYFKAKYWGPSCL